MGHWPLGGDRHPDDVMKEVKDDKEFCMPGLGSYIDATHCDVLCVVSGGLLANRSV